MSTTLDIVGDAADTITHNDQLTDYLKDKDEPQSEDIDELLYDITSSQDNWIEEPQGIEGAKEVLELRVVLNFKDDGSKEYWMLIDVGISGFGLEFEYQYSLRTERHEI